MVIEKGEQTFYKFGLQPEDIAPIEPDFKGTLLAGEDLIDP